MRNERNWSHDPIKMKAKDIAEHLFKKYFQENMKGGTIQQFKETYPTLYYQVIIPMTMELILREFQTSQMNNPVIDLLKDLDTVLKRGESIGPDSLLAKVIEVAVNK
jgi:hypothetical protein